ncbi:MAG: hypothetical protein H3C47_12045 [Candidatus Cloacimonetes bacterium]|nr:hypothetical protein [Candidatus Cloacimonadota bacterium]
MRVRVILNIGLGFVLGLFLIKLASSNQKGLVTQEVEEPIIPVRGYAIKSQEFIPVIRALAEVRSRVRPDIASEVAGKISWIHPELREGHCFMKGSSLIQIENEDYKLELSRLNQQVLVYHQELLELKTLKNELQKNGVLLKDNLIVSRRELKRQADLARTSSVPEGNIDPFQRAANQAEILVNQWQSEMDRLPLKIEKLKHQINSLSASAGIAELKIKRSEIVIPFDGCVTRKNVHLGQWVNTGQILIQVEATEGRELLARFPDGLAQKIQGPHPGWKVQVAEDHTEKVLSVSPVGNPLSRAREAVITLSHSVTPSTMMEILIQAPARKAFVLPHALCMDSTVMILNQNGVLESRPVVLGAMDANSNVEILQGLSEGILVVVESKNYARPGFKAKLVGESL